MFASHNVRQLIRQLLKCRQPTNDVGGRKCRRLKNVGVQTLTIWARQNLHSVSFSVRLKISLRRCCLSSMQSPSGICSQIRSAYMGGVSAVLARLVVPARPVKMSAPFKCPWPPTFWTSFLRKVKNLTRLISVLSLPFKFVQNHKSCPNSAASRLGL
jgi:hypothetical protein